MWQSNEFEFALSKSKFLFDNYFVNQSISRIKNMKEMYSKDEK